MLVFDALIDGKENIKFGCFCRREKLTIFQSSKTGVTSSLAIVSEERVPESLINAFVEQDAHLGASEQEVFGLFERGEGHFTRDGRKTL